MAGYLCLMPIGISLHYNSQPSILCTWQRDNRSKEWGTGNPLPEQAGNDSSDLALTIRG